MEPIDHHYGKTLVDKEIEIMTKESLAGYVPGLETRSGSVYDSNSYKLASVEDMNRAAASRSAKIAVAPRLRQLTRTAYATSAAKCPHVKQKVAAEVRDEVSKVAQPNAASPQYRLQKICTSLVENKRFWRDFSPKKIESMSQSDRDLMLASIYTGIVCIGHAVCEQKTDGSFHRITKTIKKKTKKARK